MLTWLWLVWADLFFGIFAVLLLAFGAVQAACVLSFGLAGVCLVGNLRTLPYLLLPEMPYWCGAILGLSLLALCVLAVIGCVWYFAFCRQLFRSYGRFHQNTLAQSRGAAVLPALPIVPQFAPKKKRRPAYAGAGVSAPVRGLLCAGLRSLRPVRRKLPVLARVGLVPELRGRLYVRPECGRAGLLRLHQRAGLPAVQMPGGQAKKRRADAVRRASAVKQVLPESTWTVALPVYYLAVTAFVLLTIRGFFRRNQRQYRKFSALQTA